MFVLSSFDSDFYSSIVIKMVGLFCSGIFVLLFL